MSRTYEVILQNKEGNREMYIKKRVGSVYTGEERGHGSQWGICVCILAQYIIQGTEPHFQRLDVIKVDFTVPVKSTATPFEEFNGTSILYLKVSPQCSIWKVSVEHIAKGSKLE